MSAIDIKTELKQLIERENDISLLKAIKTLLQKAGLDDTLRKKLTSRALRSEADIKSGHTLDREEVIRRTSNLTGK